jgi:hypothetical protein
MKLIKKTLLSVALCGIGCSAMAQNFKDPLLDLKPWVDDSTSGLVKVFYTGEWGGFWGDDPLVITRDAEANKVSLKTQSLKFDEISGEEIKVETLKTWIYTDNRNLGWVSYESVTTDSLGNVLSLDKETRTYGEDGSLLTKESQNLQTDYSDTIKIVNGRKVYHSGYTKTERNDTTIFTDKSGIYEMFDANGNLIHSEIPKVLSFSYGYNKKNQKIWDEGASWNAELNKFVTYNRTDYVYNEKDLLQKKESSFLNTETGEFVPLTLVEYIYNDKGLLIEEIVSDWNASTGKFKYRSGSEYGYDYDSQDRLIMETDGKVQDDYVYDHNGNLSLWFNFTKGSNGYYSGQYVNFVYEGGEKKYEAFDPAKYPTDNYPANSPVAKHGKLQVSGKNIVDVNGEVVVLKGISTHDIFWMKSCYKESAINAMVDDWGINVFRIASYAEEYVKSASEGDNRKAFIDELVDICAQKGVYCIIDWHVLNKGTNDPWTVIDEAKEFFDYMSKTHAGKAHVMYELCNEPNGEVSWARIKSYAQEVIDVIVKNDPNSIIITGTPVWSQRIIAAADSPLDYPNSMYTLHYYANTHKQELRDNADVALSKNCPIFVTEFGTCNSSGNGGFNTEESVEWFKWMNENNISWANWSFADKNETASLLKPYSCGSNKWDNLTEPGRLIKWALTDEDLSGADSVLLAAAAIKKNRHLKKVEARIDYLGDCISENPAFLLEEDVTGLVDCAFEKDCLAENAELLDDYERLKLCVYDKQNSIKDLSALLEGVYAYPNPVKDKLTVDYVGGDYTVSLIDLSGVVVLHQECTVGRSLIDVTTLAQGFYLLKIESEGKYYFEKIQKK